MAGFKNTTFREGYKPTFSEFVKGHSKIFSKEEMKEAFKACTGKSPSAKDLKSLDSPKKEKEPKEE